MRRAPPRWVKGFALAPRLGFDEDVVVLIREYAEADWPSIWDIFREVVGAGDTYVYDPAWSPEQARALWVEPPPGRTVVACDGPALLGTAKMGPNL